MSDSQRPVRGSVITIGVTVGGVLLTLAGHTVYITRAFTQVESDLRTEQKLTSEMRGQLIQLRDAHSAIREELIELKGMLRPVAADVTEIKQDLKGKRR